MCIPQYQSDQVLVGHLKPPGAHIQKLSTTGVLLPVPTPHQTRQGYTQTHWTQKCKQTGSQGMAKADQYS